MNPVDVGLKDLHQPRDIGIKRFRPHKGPVDVRQRRRNRLHGGIPDNHRDNTFRHLTVHFSSRPHTCEATESGEMKKITESALAIAVLISSIHIADGTMSSRSTHTCSSAARNAATIAATASRSLRE